MSGEEGQAGDESQDGEEHNDGGWKERGEVFWSRRPVSLNNQVVVNDEDAGRYAHSYGDDYTINICDILHHSIFQTMDIADVLLDVHLNEIKECLEEDRNHHKDGCPPWWRVFREKGQDFLASVSQSKWALGE